MANPEKKYGLILSKRGKTTELEAKPSIFGDDSDDDSKAGVNKKINLSSDKNKTKRQTQLEIDKALADDPSVYAYDELYDDMKNKEKAAAVNLLSRPTERKAKYINNLLAASEKRKKEYERRTEKLVQKQLEAEGDQFKDKERFVTSAYRAKMLEMQAAEEAERKKEALEAKMDVLKQSDLSGFYRSLYKQHLNNEPLPNKPESAAIKPQQPLSKRSPPQAGRKDNHLRSNQFSVGKRDVEENHGDGPPRLSGGSPPLLDQGGCLPKGYGKSSDPPIERHPKPISDKNPETQEYSLSYSHKEENLLSEHRLHSPVSDNKTNSAGTDEWVEKLCKKTDADSVQSARERYLSRKNAKLQSN